MKLYNTQSKQLDEVVPLNPTTVNIYTCGPTVYDFLHLGNWTGYIRWDVLVRTLKDAGLEVKWIMNITDVGHLVSDNDEGEDKLIKGAKREGKTAWEIADFYTDDFLHGVKKLNISIPTKNLVRATKHIEDQINLILKLQEKGLTYKIDDGIYFDTSKIKDYGKLFERNAKHLETDPRIKPNPQKRSQSDFALWKFSPKEETPKRDMEWQSPWGKGFPGWHIECSAMALRYLGETLDIHAGGIDHIQVHHTNEIAQSENATGKQFANIWLHTNFMTIDDKKISKSLGNGYTLQDLDKQGFNPIDFRFFVLQSHYQTQSNFTWEGLLSAKNRLLALKAIADLRFQPVKNQNSQAAQQATIIQELKQTVIDALNDDLDTPKVLFELSEFVKNFETTPLFEDNLSSFTALIQWLDEILGLRLSASIDISLAQKQLINDRYLARSENDWQQADNIRKKLLNDSLEIKDTSYGQIWYRN